MTFKVSTSQNDYLTVLTHAPAEAVKELANRVLPFLGDILVLVNRTGLVMLPYTDTATGVRFHLGEILISESHVRINNGVEGYAACNGRDQHFSLAVAILDAAMRASIEESTILGFVTDQLLSQSEADTYLLRCIEATRVEMETF